MKKPTVADFESARRTNKNAVNAVMDESERARIGNEHRIESQSVPPVNAIPTFAEKCLTAQDEQQNRVVTESPDGLSQELAMAATHLETLHRQIPGKWSPQIALISNLRQKMVFLSDGLRKMTHRLHPGTFGHPGLIMAIRSQCSEFSQTFWIPVSFSAVQIPKLSSDIALCLYRTVQEGLANVANHSKAATVWVKILRAPGGILLSIADNGCGFELGKVRLSDGLIRIRERVQAVSGQLILNSAPGKGMRLEVYLPVRSTDQ